MKYEEAHIEDMLSRFMKAETTLEEERWLADYFSSASSVPQQWRAFAVLFTGIEAGVLNQSDGARRSPDMRDCPSDASSQCHAERRIRSCLWLKATGVAALLCLCLLLGRVAWIREEPDVTGKRAATTSASHSLQSTDGQPVPSCAALTMKPPTLQSHAPRTLDHRPTPAPVLSATGKSRRLVHSEKVTAEDEGKNKSAADGQIHSSGVAEGNRTPSQSVQNELQPAPLQDDNQSDFSEHIVSAAFAYPEHSRLDEQAIRVRNRVRAEVMEQYAQICF